MDKQLKKSFLIGVKNQCELYTRLKQLELSRNTILISKDSRLMEGLVKKQEEIISEIRKIETEKKLIFEKIAGSLGLKFTPDLKLQEVLAKAGAQDAAEIERVMVILIGLMRETMAINSNNMKLMKNYLDFADFSAGLRAKAGNQVQSLYTQEGVVNNKQNVKPKFDEKI